MDARYPWLWDTDMDNCTFDALLAGRTSLPCFDTRWAMLRLVEYAPFAEIKRLLPVDGFLALWPSLLGQVRSGMRRDGMDFMYRWFLERKQFHANKVTALVDREAPKDLADLFWLCCRDGLSLAGALAGTGGKAAGIFPPVVAQALSHALQSGVPDVFWIERPAEADFDAGVQRLIREIME